MMKELTPQEFQQFVDFTDRIAMETCDKESFKQVECDEEIGNPLTDYCFEYQDLDAHTHMLLFKYAGAMHKNEYIPELYDWTGKVWVKREWYSSTLTIY